jgi:hypothetical protein
LQSRNHESHRRHNKDGADRDREQNLDKRLAFSATSHFFILTHTHLPFRQDGSYR